MLTNKKAFELFELHQTANRVRDLHKLFSPHSGQITAGRTIFSQGKKRVFLQCGRSWGKSYFAAYCGVRKALTKKNAKVYVVLPERQQASEVIWESGYLKNMIPEKYLYGGNADEAFNKTELRARLDNNSFIKLLGADNPDSLRGIKPDFVVFDEYRDFKTAVYDIMEPNLGINDATLLICSTPPDQEGDYTKLRTLFKEAMERGQENYFYMELPTETNPYFPKETLKETKEMLERRGEYGVWLREYMAQFIPGGANAVFPKFNSNKSHIVKSPGLLEALIRRDKKRLDWWCVHDPAQNSVFAQLVAAINRYTGQIFILGETYEMDRARTGSLEMWGRAISLKEVHFPFLERWRDVYDEQSAWFYNDLDRHGVLTDEVSLEPTHKKSRDKTEDMSMLKELFAVRGRIFISSACPKLIWEIENYCTDEHGEFKKVNDHQIDNLRYLLAASDYEPIEEPDPERNEESDDEAERFFKKPLSLKELFATRDADQDVNTGDMDSFENDEIVYIDELDGETY